MVSCHPNSSINVKGIDGVLDRWAAERGFIPDVIVVDYADILAPENDGKDARHQVDETWRSLRRLSQERKALVIAPTQADAASYDADVLSTSNFSEDKRKHAHVTGMLGLNQTFEEKADNIMRLNWILLRESEFDANRCLYIGQQIKLGRAMTCSLLK
jgi:replicative DNA helicase